MCVGSFVLGTSDLLIVPLVCVNAFWVIFAVSVPRTRSIVVDDFQEPWALRAHPELGFLTVIALGTEKTWLVVGTSRGFVMLWDLRFQARARSMSLWLLLWLPMLLLMLQRKSTQPVTGSACITRAGWS